MRIEMDCFGKKQPIFIYGGHVYPAIKDTQINLYGHAVRKRKI